MELPSFWQIIEQKRIQFVGGTLEKKHGCKAHRVMLEEKTESGDWWIEMTKVMQKYGLESIEHIGDLKKEQKLRLKIDGHREKEDEELKNSLFHALPREDGPTGP